jgi:anti-sigma28 factor (negative regulator of flagellin synthesis)
MRIDSVHRTPAAAGADKSESTAHSTLEKEVVAGSDQAEVSPLAQSLAQQTTDRIEQLRIQVLSGSYEVSAESVAQSLIDAHLKK